MVPAFSFAKWICKAARYLQVKGALKFTTWGLWLGWRVGGGEVRLAGPGWWGWWTETDTPRNRRLGKPGAGRLEGAGSRLRRSLEGETQSRKGARSGRDNCGGTPAPRLLTTKPRALVPPSQASGPTELQIPDKNKKRYTLLPGTRPRAWPSLIPHKDSKALHIFSISNVQKLRFFYQSA